MLALLKDYQPLADCQADRSSEAATLQPGARRSRRFHVNANKRLPILERLKTFWR